MLILLILIITPISFVNLVSLHNHNIKLVGKQQIWKTMHQSNVTKTTIIHHNNDDLLTLSLGGREMQKVDLRNDGRSQSPDFIRKKKFVIELEFQKSNFYLANSDEYMRFVEINIICRLLYGIYEFPVGYLYMCILNYKNMRTKTITPISNCTLDLIGSSGFCLINGKVAFDSLDLSQPIELHVFVYHCPNICSPRNRAYDWSFFTKKQTKFYLKPAAQNGTHLIWIDAFQDQERLVTLKLGYPAQPIRPKRLLEIPLRLVNLPLYKDWSLIAIEINFTKTMKFFAPKEYGCVKHQLMIHDVSVRPKYKPKDRSFLIHISREPDTQNLEIDDKNCFRDGLFILRLRMDDENVDNISISFFINPLEYRVSQKVITKILYWNDPKIILFPFFRYSSQIFVAKKNPIIFPSIDQNKHTQMPFQLKSFFSYAVYYSRGVTITDVIDTIFCRPLNSKFLKCPPNSAPLTNQSGLNFNDINTKGYDWFIELFYRNWHIFIDFQPVLQPVDKWQVVSNDYVLNKINYFQNDIIENKESNPHSQCNTLYQTALVNLYRKMEFRDSVNKQKILLVDYSDQLKTATPKIEPKSAVVYHFNNYSLIKTHEKGEFRLEFVNQITIQNNIRFLTTDKMVILKNIKVECIRNVSVGLTYTVSANWNLTVTNIEYSLDKEFDIASNCFMIFLLEFSDNTIIDLSTLLFKLYNLRFITGRNIIPVNEINDLWYDYGKFNQETSFFVEISETSFCQNSKIIFKRRVSLDKSKPTYNKMTTKNKRMTSKLGKKSKSSTKLPITTASSTQIFTKQPSTAAKPVATTLLSAENRIIVILCTVCIVALLIVCINILVTCFFRRYRSQAHYVLCCHKPPNHPINRPTSIPHAIITDTYPPLLPPRSQSIALQSSNSFWGLEKGDNDPNSMIIKQGLSRQFSFPPIGSNGCHSLSPTSTELSSGLGTMNTNMDDITLNDPYDCKEQYNRLSKMTSEYGPM